MQKIIQLSAVFLFLFGFASCDSAPAETGDVSLKVTGMTWGVACVKKVRSALESVEGVENPQVSMPDSASYDGAAKPEDVIAAIKKAGFEAELRK